MESFAEFEELVAHLLAHRIEDAGVINRSENRFTKRVRDYDALPYTYVNFY